MEDGMDEETLRERSKTSASNAFAACELSLSNSAVGLRIPTPPYINISGTSSWFECCSALTRLSLPRLRRVHCKASR